MQTIEKKPNGHKIMVEIRVSVHTWKHLKYIKNTNPDCRTYDDAIDTLLNKADMDWDCMDKDDFQAVVGDCPHYSREEINLVLDGKTPPVLWCKDCGKYLD